MYSAGPNGDQLVEGMVSDGGSADMDYANDSEDDGDDSDDSEEVESPPRTEHRTKQTQDPAASQGMVVVSTVKNQKRTRTPNPDPTEKTAKQAKAVPPKPRKAPPRIKVTVPIAST